MIPPTEGGPIVLTERERKTSKMIAEPRLYKKHKKLIILVWALPPRGELNKQRQHGAKSPRMSSRPIANGG